MNDQSLHNAGHDREKLTRRSFLWRLLALPTGIALAGCDLLPNSILQRAGTPIAATPIAQVLTPTPACDDDDDETPAQTEGPFYTPNTPMRTSLLEPGITGTKLTVTGLVLSKSCQPIAHTLVDFWHADDQGEYDNVGFKLRGHQFTDASGRYTLETIVPGLYPGRTRHIHVKVQAANQPVLTTQLYFPGEPRNERDGIFHPDLIMAVRDVADGKTAQFDFVLDVA